MQRCRIRLRVGRGTKQSFRLRQFAGVNQGGSLIQNVRAARLRECVSRKRYLQTNDKQSDARGGTVQDADSPGAPRFLQPTPPDCSYPQHRVHKYSQIEAQLCIEGIRAWQKKWVDSFCGCPPGEALSAQKENFTAPCMTREGKFASVVVISPN
jgi:hypothetical protein